MAAWPDSVVTELRGDGPRGESVPLNIVILDESGAEITFPASAVTIAPSLSKTEIKIRVRQKVLALSLQPASPKRARILGIRELRSGGK